MWAYHGINPDTPMNPARLMVRRFLELKALARLGHRVERFDDLELSCFATIEMEISRQREAETKKGRK